MWSTKNPEQGNVQAPTVDSVETFKYSENGGEAPCLSKAPNKESVKAIKRKYVIEPNVQSLQAEIPFSQGSYQESVFMTRNRCINNCD